MLDACTQNVNGSLKELVPPGDQYVGIDFATGEGVDLGLDDPYRLELLPFSINRIDHLIRTRQFICC
jgi:hypothetical protein